MFTPGSRACGYRTASGRAKWPNRDPLEEQGGVNLYAFVANNGINRIEYLGFFSIEALLPNAGTFELGHIPVPGLPPGCGLVGTITVKSEGGCKVYEIGAGVSCSVRQKLIDKLVKRIPGIGETLDRYLPDVSAQGWIEGVVRNCCGCVDACEFSLNGAFTVGNGRRGGGETVGQREVIELGATGEVNGIVNLCQGTLRLDATAVFSFSMNFEQLGENGWFPAFNLDKEFSGTLLGGKTQFEGLKWFKPCK
ncbi:MAG: hypothetical protein BWX44_01504 [Spirochaetes bacterium ADurb.Bin001]|nr:MAG: hypothetical protein BWX44_01504 [Spirochaetes bacterium ADurb.Bin001]